MLELWEMLGLELTIIMSICSIIWFLYFFNKLIQMRKRPRELLPILGLTFVFLFGGISHFLAVWFDFFRWEYGISIFSLNKLSNLLIWGSLIGLALMWESVIRKTKFLLTGYLLIGVIGFLFIQSFDEAQVFIIIFSVPALIVGLPYGIFHLLSRLRVT